MRILVCILCLNIFLNASQIVLFAIKDINYKALLTNQNISKKPLLKKDKELRCLPFTQEALEAGNYRAKHYIKKGSIICKKDVYLPQNNRVIFNFGAIKIEKSGKVVRETSNYVRIKNESGKVEKIYKDGRIK